MLNFDLNNRFEEEMPADTELKNFRRQVKHAAYSYVTPRIPSNPSLIHVSNEMAENLALTKEQVNSDEFLELVSGKVVFPNSNPYAMCYAGHQFGNWAGQLGDGRAINLMEVKAKGLQWTLQLKGAGETPYSRSADGLAVLRSSIREHLCSEAMHHLGVPTTRSLSLSLTGDEVLRDVLYNGNPAFEKGAVVCRVAPSFVRFGNFEIFAANEDHDNLQKLVDYSIKNLYPSVKSKGKEAVIEFFNEVVQNTLEMIIHWQRVGFVHGVMNTDNMSIVGLTIDYGPYGWLEDYDPGWTPNTTDSGQKRYRFGNQAKIALWNLVRLANALFPLVGEAKPFEKALDQYQDDFQEKYLSMMSKKLGLEQSNQELVDELDKVLQLTETDFTIFFRLLADIDVVKSTFEEAMRVVNDAFYKPEELELPTVKENWKDWFEKYLGIAQKENVLPSLRKEKMNAVNPKYVLRNYMAQLAIDAADSGDYTLIDDLYQMLLKPYDEQVENEKWFAKRPDWARTKVGCSMLSCSS